MGGRFGFSFGYRNGVWGSSVAHISHTCPVNLSWYPILALSVYDLPSVLAPVMFSSPETSSLFTRTASSSFNFSP